MIKKASHTFLKYLTPLDFASIFYVVFSGAYLFFGRERLINVQEHFYIRLLLLIVIISLLTFSVKYPKNKMIIFFRGIYPIFFISFFYTETSSLKNILFHNNLDVFFYNAEQNLWHCQPSIAFSKFMNDAWFNEIMNLCYFSYYIIIIITCILLFMKNTLPAQKAIFTVFFSFYLYYIIFDILPVAGPQYYAVNLNSEPLPPYFFGKIMHQILINIEKPTGAFPSSHVGIACIIAYVFFKQFKKIFFIILPFVIGICFATVYLKAHYLVDVIAGVFSAFLFILISEYVFNKISILTKGWINNKNPFYN